MDKISEFDGEYAWLSNFWPSVIMVDVIEYPTVEHAFQAAKVLDLKLRKAISLLDTPGEAKHVGNKVRLREDWETVKVAIMYDLLCKKFEDLWLRDRLIETESLYLEEGNTWKDRIWGVYPPNSGNGRNLLGELLMMVRYFIIGGKQCLN